MKKILMSTVMIGLFYGCSVREVEQEKSMLEMLKESQAEGLETIIIPEGGEINIKEFFALSEEEQVIRAKEIEKEVKRARRDYFAKRGIFYNENDSDDVKTKKATEQSLEVFVKSLPPSEIKRRLLEGVEKKKGGKKYKNIEKIKSLIEDEDIEGVAKMLKNGFDVNMIIDTFYKHTIIYDAIKTKNLELVKIIVKNGAKLNIEDLNHNTPIVYAAKLGNKAIVEYLLNQKIDILKESSLLQEILVFNDSKLIDKCLAKGLDINIKNIEGNTPLIMAIYNRANLKTIKYLIKKGANLDVISSDNKNILEIAKINNREEIYNYLKTIYKPKKNINLLNNKQSEILKLIHNQHNTFAIKKIDLSKDEKIFVSVDHSGNIRVFNLTNGKLIRKIEDNQDAIFLKLLNNNRLIVSSSSKIKIWDINSGKLLKTLSEQSIEGEIESNKAIEEVKKTSMYKYANKKNRNILKSITEIFDNQIRKAIQKQFNITDEKNICIYDIDVTPDNQKIIVSKSSGNINIWDIEKGKVVKVIEDKKAMSLTTIDNNQIIYSNKDNIVNILNINTEYEIKVVDNKNYRTKKIYKLGKYIFIDNSSTYLRVMNLETKKEEAGFFFYSPITDIVMADNRKVIVGTSNGKIYQGDMLSVPKRKNNILSHDIKMIGYHNTGIKDLIILPKSKDLLSVDADAIKLWKLL